MTVTNENELKMKSFEEMKPVWREYISYWKSYPDRFIDFIKPTDCKIDLYFYQRMMLRILFRYKEVFFTFTRGTAKSFTQILALYLKCVFFPNLSLFIVAPGKEQASKISRENIESIWNFFPLLKDEVRKYRFEKDYVILYFHNGSRLDVVQCEQSSRGGRRHGGAVEEIVEMDSKKDELNEVVIPMMANDRISEFGGKKDPNELHKFQYFVTTAGTRQSFAFEKLKEISQAMSEGKSAYVLGAGFELACMHGQLDIDFINELRLKPTFNPLSFAREYESVWTGSSDHSLVSLEDLNVCRTLKKAEWKADKKEMDRDNVEYVLAYDVARAEGKNRADCALAVIKITPKGDGAYQKDVVNIFTFEGTHFVEQARFLKRKVEEYSARMLVVDANGLGKGLVDQLVIKVDEHPPYSVVNDDRYDRFKTEDSIPMVFAITSQSKDMKAADIHNVFMNSITNHRVRLLNTEAEARASYKEGTESEKIARECLPFTMTDLLCEEIMNLEYKQAGNQTKVEQISKSINKDKFSALEYGLWYISTLEKNNKVRRESRTDGWKFMAIKKPKSSLERW